MLCQPSHPCWAGSENTDPSPAEGGNAKFTAQHLVATELMELTAKIQALLQATWTRASGCQSLHGDFPGLDRGIHGKIMVEGSLEVKLDKY